MHWPGEAKDRDLYQASGKCGQHRRRGVGRYSPSRWLIGEGAYARGPGCCCASSRRGQLGVVPPGGAVAFAITFHRTEGSLRASTRCTSETRAGS